MNTGGVTGGNSEKLRQLVTSAVKQLHEKGECNLKFAFSVTTSTTTDYYAIQYRVNQETIKCIGESYSDISAEEFNSSNYDSIGVYLLIEG